MTLIKVKQNRSGIQYITKRAFMKRFEKVDRIFLRKSPDDDIIDMMEDLMMAAYVDLKDPELSAGITTITALPQITTTSEVLLAVGTISEKYNGVL